MFNDNTKRHERQVYNVLIFIVSYLRKEMVAGKVSSGSAVVSFNISDLICNQSANRADSTSHFNLKKKIITYPSLLSPCLQTESFYFSLILKT